MATSLSLSSLEDATAYINGRVYTINAEQPWVEAFVVGSDGFIKAIGTTEAIELEAKQNKLTIYDLRGHFIMPGIHDAHVHVLTSSVAKLSQIALPMEMTTAVAIEELKKGSCMCKYSHANEDWLVGHTFVVSDFDREELDKEFPDTPIVLRGGAGHGAYLNSEALRRAGYDVRSEADGQGTKYFRDDAEHLTGEVAENSMSKFTTIMPKPNLTHAKRSLRDGIRTLHRAGVTSCQEASASTLMLHALQGLEREGALKINIQTHIVYAPDWIAEERTETLHKTLNNAEKFQSEHVDTRFMKIILDGVPLPPYFSHAALRDDNSVDESKLLMLNVKEAVQQYDAKGMTVKIHCTGQGATRLAFDAFEAARKGNPTGPKHEIAHCCGVHEDELRRFQELNVTAEMSPALFFDNRITEASEGLMNWSFEKLQTAGASMTIGSDWNPGSPPDLLPCLAGVVKRIGGGDIGLGGERLCRMLTLAGAEAVGRDKEWGSIEVGKRANLIAVDRDLSRGEFAGATVVRTWFEGEIVFEKE